jgi:hypothetical protein
LEPVPLRKTEEFDCCSVAWCVWCCWSLGACEIDRCDFFKKERCDLEEVREMRMHALVVANLQSSGHIRSLPK